MKWGALALVGSLVVGTACRGKPAPPAIDAPAFVDVAPSKPAASEAGAISTIAPPPPSAAPDAGLEKRDACLRKDSSIRSADWANCSIGTFGKLRNGRGEYHEYDQLGGPHDTIDTKLVGVDYGDVDGDGLEDAVVALVQHVYFAKGRNTSESGQVYVYSTKSGVVTLVAHHSGRPVTSVKVVTGRVVLDEASKYETCKTELVVRAEKLETGSERCTKRP